MADLRNFKPGKIKPTASPGTSMSGMHMTMEEGMNSKNSEQQLTEESSVTAPHNIAETSYLDTDKSEEVIEQYREYLQENGIGDAEIFGALDSLLTTGDVLWSFQLLNKIDVVLRTRPNWVNELLMEELEEVNPKLYARFAGMVGMYNLAGSLVEYGGKRFEPSNPEEFHAAYDFVNSISYILQNRLIKQMAIFDRLIAVATSDWALKNFTPPQLEESV